MNFTVGIHYKKKLDEENTYVGSEYSVEQQNVKEDKLIADFERNQIFACC